MVLLALLWLSMPCLALPESAPSRQQVPMNAATPFNSPTNWSEPPSPDATGHHIFNSISSLTLRWPNTMWKNGHTIAPGTIPAGTLLYHGTIVHNGSIPSGADWLGFDFSTSYAYCGLPCRVATFTASRDLQILHFDGLSAAKVVQFENGHMDTQDLLTWGKIHRERNSTTWDFARLDALCEWGRRFNIDGFVRMQWNFELMHCDFTNGLQLVEFSEHIPTSEPLEGAGEPEPWEGWKGEMVDGKHVLVELFLDGQRHDRMGEIHVQVDYSSAISFYDPAVSSLVDARRGLPRIRHSLAGISAEDVDMKLGELYDVLQRDKSRSGVIWPSVFRAIFDRYADRLQTLNYTLSLPDADISHLKNVRQQVLVLLLPHMRPSDVPSTSGDNSWAAPIVERCARSPSAHVSQNLFTPQEMLIQDAIEVTLREICRRLVLVWVDAFDVEALEDEQVPATLASSQAQVSALMRWLDWAGFNRCIPGCGKGEFCYIATWPLPFPEDGFYNLTPRCVSQNFADWPQPY